MNLEIVSRSEALEKGLKRYFTGKPCKHGHVAERRSVGCGCVSCGIEQGRRWIKANEVLHANRTKSWRDANPAKWRSIKQRYRETNRQPDRAYAKARREADPLRYRVEQKTTQARRRARKLQATVSGYEAEITAIYKACPPGWHVDHIIPLKHPDVAGLHVPWNLQYLPGSVNSAKSNIFDLEKYPAQGQIGHAQRLRFD